MSDHRGGERIDLTGDDDEVVNLADDGSESPPLYASSSKRKCDSPIHDAVAKASKGNEAASVPVHAQLPQQYAAPAPGSANYDGVPKASGGNEAAIVDSMLDQFNTPRGRTLREVKQFFLAMETKLPADHIVATLCKPMLIAKNCSVYHDVPKASGGNEAAIVAHMLEKFNTPECRKLHEIMQFCLAMRTKLPADHVVATLCKSVLFAIDAKNNPDSDDV